MRNLLSRVREIYSLHQAKNLLNKASKEYKIPGTEVYHTPDAPLVDAKDFHLVLVYDTMMQHGPNHAKIKAVSHGYEGQGITEENVEAWRNIHSYEVLAFPAFNKLAKPAWMNQTGANPSPIRGELFKITARGIFTLDKTMENTIKYNRMEVGVVAWLRKNYFSHLHNRTHTTHENPRFYKAWMYFANPDKWGSISVYDGWQPLPIYPPRKSEKGDGIYYNSQRNKPSVI